MDIFIYLFIYFKVFTFEIIKKKKIFRKQISSQFSVQKKTKNIPRDWV